MIIAVATGFVAGAFAGAMGVGGGVIMVPVLAEVLGAGQHLAQGTSLAVIVVTAIVGSVSSRRAGLLDLRVAGWVAIGGIFGAVAGSLLALTVFNEETLRRGFGLIVLLTAARMIASSLRGDPDRQRQAGT